MSTFSVKCLKDKLGSKFFHITHIDAVKDDNSNNLDALLDLKADDSDFVRITNLEIDKLFLG